MVRAYGIKVPKSLKRKRSDEELGSEGADYRDHAREDEMKNVDLIEDMPSIPIMPPVDESKKHGVIFILDKAPLEIGKVGNKHQLLNSDEHANFLKKQGKDPSEYRPDIVHQAILAILDSPLTKAGRLQALYIHSTRNAIIEVKPHVRIPRTFRRFCGLMVQLLEKQKITAVGNREKLLALIKNPVTDHLPVNSRKIGLSYSSNKLVHVRDYVAAASDDVNLVFVVGAMAHGVIDKGYIDDFISVSNYPLSAACCLSRICNALEQKWKIL
ncbi:ribosomal RNA small subunit methyltransferase nep-1 [Phalaenopsis equestris]|uniref:ribosomal RNA small subunit methyltransferase nep-1 n=1 Tax=Phalaenopsis equestris TaxID=78828 RepID=UPI0009E439A8|nr:ribosomal RNA small subunit methyltransferase nep-1 [Phalaenopsis equestris]XP_020573613.1 ribosomal RNA small subunit methyltransferase nep-1 [Phalaenopsis equestris]